MARKEAARSDGRRWLRSSSSLALRQRSASRVSRRVGSERRAEAPSPGEKLLALGQAEIDRHPTAALAYTTRSLEMSDTPEGRLQALRILWKAPPARVLSVPGGVQALSLDFSRTAAGLRPPASIPGAALFAEDGRLAQRPRRKERRARPIVPFTAFGGDAVFRWTSGDEVSPGTSTGALSGLRRNAVVGDGSDDGHFTISPPPTGTSTPLLKQWSVSRGITRLVRSLKGRKTRDPMPASFGSSVSPGPSLFVRPVPPAALPGPPVLGRHEADIVYWDAPAGGGKVP